MIKLTVKHPKLNGVCGIGDVVCFVENHKLKECLRNQKNGKLKIRCRGDFSPDFKLSV